MARWIRLSTKHWAVLFVVMAIGAAGVAWESVGLVNLAMANADFLTRHGRMAILEGGLVQTLEIGARALAVMLFYFLFKGAESELIARWRQK
jgi:hypothetical protein